MKITMTIELPVENEIQFFDACKGAAQKLTELARRALDAGDLAGCKGLHDIVTENDDAELVGQIRVR